MKKKRIILGLAVMLIATIVVIIGVKLFLDDGMGEWDTVIKGDQADYQSYWMAQGTLMESEAGYYCVKRMGQNNTIYQTDSGCKTLNIICTKANCKHQDDSCQAVLPENATNVRYVNGYFFYLDKDDDNDMYLCRCNSQGTDREKLLLIGEVNQVHSSKVDIHRNYVISNEIHNDNQTTRIVVYDMENDKEYEVDESSKVELQTRDIVGNRLLYSSYDGKHTAIMVYDLVSGNKEELTKIEGNLGYIRFVGESVCYTSQKGNYVFKVSNPDEITCLDEGAAEQLASDGTYIYIDNVPMYKDGEAANEAQVINVYEPNGKKVGSIKVPKEDKKTIVGYMGDGSRLFATGFSTNKVYVYDLSQGIKEDGQWTYMECEE